MTEVSTYAVTTDFTIYIFFAGVLVSLILND